MPTPLSPTPRTTPRRHSERALDDRQALYEVLDEALVGHLAVVVGGAPLVLPTTFGYDPDGPDADGTLYLHGSVAAGSLAAAEATEVCFTITIVDGLVLARSGFHHSMNYRSAVIRGRARVVSSDDERRRALDLVVDHVVPGRSQSLRRPTRKELAATAVLALPLHEASVKARTGGVADDAADVERGEWAGVVDLRTSVGLVRPDEAATEVEMPRHVRERIILFGH